MKKKAVLLLILFMLALTACGTKENVKSDVATEQVTKDESTETVQAETESQAQEVKKPEESNTRVIKGFRSRLWRQQMTMKHMKFNIVYMAIGETTRRKKSRTLEIP